MMENPVDRALRELEENKPTEAVLQKIADSFLPFFDNMPSIKIFVMDSTNKAIKKCAAYYKGTYATVEFSTDLKRWTPSQIKDVVKHELCHAWVHWMGFATDTVKGVDVNGHNEWFLWKAHEVGLDENIQYLFKEYPVLTPIWEKILQGGKPPKTLLAIQTAFDSDSRSAFNYKGMPKNDPAKPWGYMVAALVVFLLVGCLIIGWIYRDSLGTPLGVAFIIIWFLLTFFTLLMMEGKWKLRR